jgi:hypothetical protein
VLSIWRQCQSRPSQFSDGKYVKTWVSAFRKRTRIEWRNLACEANIATIDFWSHFVWTADAEKTKVCCLDYKRLSIQSFLSSCRPIWTRIEKQINQLDRAMTVTATTARNSFITINKRTNISISVLVSRENFRNVNDARTPKFPSIWDSMSRWVDESMSRLDS